MIENLTQMASPSPSFPPKHHHLSVLVTPDQLKTFTRNQTKDAPLSLGPPINNSNRDNLGGRRKHSSLERPNNTKNFTSRPLSLPGGNNRHHGRNFQQTRSAVRFNPHHHSATNGTHNSNSSRESFPLSHNTNNNWKSNPNLHSNSNSNSKQSHTKNHPSNTTATTTQQPTTKLFRSTARNLFEDANNYPTSPEKTKALPHPAQIAPIDIPSSSSSTKSTPSRNHVSFSSESPLFKPVDIGKRNRRQGTEKGSNELLLSDASCVTPGSHKKKSSHNSRHKKKRLSSAKSATSSSGGDKPPTHMMTRQVTREELLQFLDEEKNGDNNPQDNKQQPDPVLSNIDLDETVAVLLSPTKKRRTFSSSGKKRIRPTIKTPVNLMMSKKVTPEELKVSE